MRSLRIIAVLMTLHAMCLGDTPCSVGNDCPKTMCCKGPPATQGYCRPLKPLGQDCQMYSGVPSWGQSPWKVTECNCEDELYCGSDNPSPPLGSRGTCRTMSPWP